MHELVPSNLPTRTKRSRRLPSFAGKGLPERMRSTAFVFLGLTAAVGLALVAVFAQLNFPLLSPVPLPGGPSEGGAVGKAVALDQAEGALALATAGPGIAAAGAQGRKEAAGVKRGGDEVGVVGAPSPVPAPEAGVDRADGGPTGTPPSTPAPPPSPVSDEAPSSTTGQTPVTAPIPAGSPEPKSKDEKKQSAKSKSKPGKKKSKKPPKDDEKAAKKDSKAAKADEKADKKDSKAEKKPAEADEKAAEDDAKPGKDEANDPEADDDYAPEYAPKAPAPAPQEPAAKDKGKAFGHDK